MQLASLIVVSGGDAPGINTAIHSYVERAAGQAEQVYGADGGFAGLLAGQIIELTPRMTLPWSVLPGAFLRSSREPVLAAADARPRLLAILERLQVDRMVLFGGNGTLRYIPPLLAEWGVRAVGLPATIDNDVAFSELTLGFDSACNFAYGVIDGMIATGHALAGRIFTLETLGGDTGFLALAIAHGASADVVLLPEYAYESDWVARRLADAVARRGFGLMIYSEGLPGKAALLDAIPALAGTRVRTSQLGHAQRGGRPSHRDRTLAVEMAGMAFEAEMGSGIIVVRDGRLTLIERAPTDAARLPDRSLYDQINGLS